jgi:hypothetical protein
LTDEEILDVFGFKENQNIHSLDRPPSTKQSEIFANEIMEEFLLEE